MWLYFNSFLVFRFWLFIICWVAVRTALPNPILPPPSSVTWRSQETRGERGVLEGLNEEVEQKAKRFADGPGADGSSGYILLCLLLCSEVMS